VVLVGESIRGNHPAHEFFVKRYRRSREIYVAQFIRKIRQDIDPDMDLEKWLS